MKISLNGAVTALEDGAAVVDAVAAAGHGGGSFGVAVAVNGEVVPRAQWAETVLKETDRVEVLVAAQGG